MPRRARFPTSSAGISACSSAGSTRVASPRRRGRTSRTRATTSGGCCTRRASRRRLLAPAEQCAGARRRGRRHERSPPHDARLVGPPRRGLRRQRGAAGATRARLASRCGSRSSGRRPTAGRSRNARSSVCKTGRLARRRDSSSCRRPHPRTPRSRGRNGSAGSRSWRARVCPSSVPPLARSVLDRRDRVLLHRFVVPGDPGVWITPGGALEGGESLEDALRRELAEELQLADVDLGPWVWTRRHVWFWPAHGQDLRHA